jgi:hypothetical protein
MIPVIPKPEPVDFNAKVRIPGTIFLSSCPYPHNHEWKGHSYWKKISNDLYILYNGICAYTGEWFSRTSTSVSIDHLIPKSTAPQLAYEWNNYRLTTQKVNNNKGDNLDIVDPFTVESGWFTLDVPSCLIKPGDFLPPSIRAKVDRTINVLQLNEDDEYVQNRCNIILYYIQGDISLGYMRQKYPYIAHELTRQNLLHDVSAIFEYNFLNIGGRNFKI